MRPTIVFNIALLLTSLLGNRDRTYLLHTRNTFGVPLFQTFEGNAPLEVLGPDDFFFRDGSQSLNPLKSLILHTYYHVLLYCTNTINVPEPRLSSYISLIPLSPRSHNLHLSLSQPTMAYMTGKVGNVAHVMKLVSTGGCVVIWLVRSHGGLDAVPPWDFRSGLPCAHVPFDYREYSNLI